MRRHGDRAQRAAEREAAGIAHEDRRGRGVEPQEGETRAHDRRAEDRQFARTLDMGNAEIGREVDAADEIGDQREGPRGDDDRHGRQPVEPVGEVHRIARADDDDRGEGVVEDPQLDPEVIDEGDIDEGVDLADDDIAGDTRNREFHQQADARRNALVAGLGNLVVIVEEPDQAEAQRHGETGPDERIAQIHPDQHRQRQADQDHQPAHGRRAALGEVGLRPVLADRLALALADAQHGDETRANDEADDQRGHQCRSGTERLVAHEVEKAFEIQPFGEDV